MTSKIKVDNIENQCGGAVVTKCGGTTTISGSVVKSNTLQASDAGNIISQSGTTITLGASGETINLASGASQSGFGRTGTVNWNTTPVTSTPTTGVNGVGYFINSTAGVKTVNLPASPSAGDIMAVSDYAGTSDTNAITIGRNGSNINGAAADIVIEQENSAVTLVYVDGTQGWKATDTSSLSDVAIQPAFIVATSPCVTTVGDYKIHRFTGPGDFIVCSAGNSLGSDKVDSLLVAGGAGAGGNLSGGGGAGGVVLIASCNASALTVTSYPIVIGGGGAGSPNATGTSGSNTTGLTLTAIGGGTSGPAGTGAAGTPGGSGGGAAGGSSPTISNGGTATQPPQPGNSGTYGFGSAGGNRTPAGSAANGGGAGGGGATAVGSDQPGSGPGGPGGVGKDATPIFGASPQTFYGPTNGVYAGGGGGGSNPGCGGSGGSGGGAPGGSCGPGVAGGNGSTNSGGAGGGGSGGCGNGGSGGSGIVIIRYKFQ